ncbi:hypothetical protein HYU11_01955 [Candidatus Woesearchaeota archaeon]|nr:hypothetical protein [Candidatus Woesearchaeota archaeon]
MIKYLKRKPKDPFEMLDALMPPSKPTLMISDKEWERKMVEIKKGSLKRF